MQKIAYILLVHFNDQNACQVFIERCYSVVPLAYQETCLILSQSQPVLREMLRNLSLVRVLLSDSVFMKDEDVTTGAWLGRFEDLKRMC